MPVMENIQCWRFEKKLQYKRECEMQGVYKEVGGTRWRSWLRHCVKSREVAASIPYGVIAIFH
jgi:hypothetical protein